MNPGRGKVQRSKGRIARWGRLAVTACGALALLAGGGVSAAADEADSIPVAATFDGRPFRYQVVSTVPNSGFHVLHLRYPSPITTPVEQNNTIPAEYYLPDGVGAGGPPRPAVICLHILDGDFQLVRMTCSMLASHGVPALMFKLPYYGERGFPQGPRALAHRPELFVAALRQAGSDVRRTVDLLASRPEVDAQRIGITGISLGGIVAASAAAIEPRLDRAMLILAGGDLPAIIDHADETDELRKTIARLPEARRREIRQALEEVDPLRHAAALRARARQGRVLMVNAREDEVVPRRCTEALAEALGISDRVRWLDGLGHYTAMAAMPQILNSLVDFFAPDQARPPAPADENGAAGQVASLMRRAAALVSAEPAEGRCHFVDLAVEVRPKKGSPFRLAIRFLRGHGARYFLDGDISSFGHALLGHGEFPWMVVGETVLVGSVAEQSPAGAAPLRFADPANRLKLQVGAGALAAAAAAPGVLEQLIRVADESPADGPRRLRLGPTKGHDWSARLEFDGDGHTLRKVSVETSDGSATAEIRVFQTDTVARPSLFAPPAGKQRRQVARADLDRVVSAIFDFALESLLQ